MQKGAWVLVTSNMLWVASRLPCILPWLFAASLPATHLGKQVVCFVRDIVDKADPGDKGAHIGAVGGPYRLVLLQLLHRDSPGHGRRSWVGVGEKEREPGEQEQGDVRIKGDKQVHKTSFQRQGPETHLKRAR